MDYVVVIEKSGDGSFSAYVPDLPGCVTSGDSVLALGPLQAAASTTTSDRTTHAA